MKHYYLFIGLSLLTAGTIKAQDKPVHSTVNGTVTDQNKKPLDYATVVLYKQADSSLVRSAFTDEAGKYQFLLVKPGSYFVKSSMMGHSTIKSAFFKVDEKTPVITLQNLALTGTSQNLKEVQITSVKPLFERKPDKLVMNVENNSLMTGNTALEVLQKAPGVTVDQNDNISMQGKQGVLIQIDGKMTYMSNADVTNLLRNMQSSQLESIELITNPSAKYEASGNSGIINIKTRKSRNVGTNGNASAGLGYGKNFSENGSLNLNHRTETVNIFGSYNLGNNKREKTTSIDRISGQDANQTYFIQRSDELRRSTSNNFKAGLDVFIDKKNTLGFLFTGYANNATERADNVTKIGPSFVKIDSSVVAKNSSKEKYQNFSYNINYKSVLDSAGQEITADVDYSKYNSNNNAFYNNRYLYADGSEIRPFLNLRNSSPSSIEVKAFKIDYTLPFTKTLKMETGVKSSWVKTDNDFIAEELKADKWQNDTKRSNRFVYDENVNAAYVNLSQQFNKTSVQIGLRAEQTNSKGNSITENKVTKRSYLDFFPSVFVNQNLSETQTIGASYSRRIDRPGYDALNPFVYYLDQYTYNQGNPFLTPQYTHNFEVNYTYKRYSLSLNYSRVSDVIAEVVLPNDEKKALFQTYANIAKNISYSANLNVPVTIFKWWQANNNLNVFHLKFDAPDLGGQKVSTSKTSFQFRSQHSFKISPTMNADFSGNYTSPLDYGTLALHSRHSFDVGLSKFFMDKKINVKLALNDVFNTLETKLNSNYPGLNYLVRNKNESRVGRLTVSYKFGKNEIKPARRRTTGVEDESGRMKN